MLNRWRTHHSDLLPINFPQMFDSHVIGPHLKRPSQSIELSPLFTASHFYTFRTKMVNILFFRKLILIIWPLAYHILSLFTLFNSINFCVFYKGNVQWSLFISVDSNASQNLCPHSTHFIRILRITLKWWFVSWLRLPSRRSWIWKGTYHF